MLNETKPISVLNYNENCVCINIAPGKSAILESSEYGEPNVLPLTLDEIRYANNSSIFKNGTLEFPEDIEDEIYDILRINKNDVLKLNDIREILISPTKEGLKKIIAIKSSTDFERVRGQFFKLKAEGYKLTLDVADLINRRYKELANNQVTTRIIIDDADMVSPEKRKISELEKQVAEMKKILEQTLASKTEDSINHVPKASIEMDIEETKHKKSPGRPRKVVSE